MNINGRMKNIVFACIVGFLVLSYSCSTSKSSQYQPSEETPEKYRQAQIDHYYSGKTLFEISCTDCHHKKKSLKTFTLDQLDEYEIRFTNSSHSENLGASDISEKELEQIMFYLKETVSRRAE